MRARIALVCSAASLAACLVAPSARATDCSGLFSPCVNDDTLWPHAGPSRFVAVGSTDTVAGGQVGFGLVTSYLSRPIILVSPSPGPSGTNEYVVDNQVNGTFLWSYGVTNRLELDIAVPLTFAQNGTGLAPITGGDGLKDTAVRDMRFGFAYAIVPHPRVGPEPSHSWGLTGRLEVSAPTGDSDQFAGERSGVFVPSLAGDWRQGRFFLGAELGARLRPTTEVVGARIGTQLVVAAGAGYDILPRRDLLAATLEAWVLPDFSQQHDVTEPQPGTFVSTPNGQYIAPAEWQLGLRSAPLRGGDLSFQLGGGGGFRVSSDQPITTPRFRFTLGVRWAPLGRDSDGDGIPDLSDRCPAQPAHTPNGCPAEPAPTGSPAFSVELGLAAAHDACTSDPDVVDGFKDTDGCPDEDQDKDGVPDRFDKCPLVPEDYAGPTDGCPEPRK